MRKIVAFGFIALNTLLLQPLPTLAQNSQDRGRIAEIFTGRWSGYFPCGPNLYILEYSVSGNDLIQTVISNGGENCLPNGHVSTVAQIPDDVSEGSVFTSIIYLGTGDQTRSVEMKIIDVNTLEYDGVRLNRHTQNLNLNGTWNDSWGSGVWQIEHNLLRGEFTVFLPNSTSTTRGMYQGRFTGQNEIAVEFNDDLVDPTNCCTGVLTPDAREIRWSNGAVWSRQ